MGNGGKIITGPLDIWLDRNSGTDFTLGMPPYANQINFSGEPTLVENQVELFQLPVHQRSTHIRQSHNRGVQVVKFKIEEASLDNLALAFPFSQRLTEMGNEELWIGISDGSESINKQSMLLRGKNPKGKTVEFYAPHTVIRGTVSQEHKRDATQGIPVEVFCILPNGCDNDLLDGEGSFDALGDWTLTSNATDPADDPIVEDGVLRFRVSDAAESASQDLATVLFPRVGGVVGGYQLRYGSKYVVDFEVPRWAVGDVAVSLAGISSGTLTINPAVAKSGGKFSVEIFLDFPVGTPPVPSSQIVIFDAPSGADFDIDNVMVYPADAFTSIEYDTP